MARTHLKLWYDPDADDLEVTFDQRPGFFRETQSDQVMETVDEQGNLLGSPAPLLPRACKTDNPALDGRCSGPLRRAPVEPRRQACGTRRGN